MIPLIEPETGIRLSGGHAALYLRMLALFARDPTVNHLKAAILHQDRQEAYLHAHTLKGLSAQLSLPALNIEAANLCRLLRSDAKMMNALPETLLSAYDRTIDAIQQITRDS